MKAETIIDRHVSSEIDDFASPQLDFCQGYQSQQEISARCFHPSEAYVEFPLEDVETSIPSRFEKVVRSYQDRLALGTSSLQLTYGELNRAANRIAHAILRVCGETPQPIGLLFDHGIAAIIAILGALKAGKFYVPLDPSLPLSRIDEMLQDCGATCIVTDTRNVATARRLIHRGGAVIDVDNPELPKSVENLGLAISPDALAYLVYTSGSSGRPKGVAQKHNYVLYHVFELSHSIHICPADRVSLLFPWSFAGGGHSISTTLLHGAALLPMDARIEGFHRLVELLVEEKITIHHSTATMLRQLIAALAPDRRLPSLRVLRLTGEPIAVTDVENAFKAVSNRCVVIGDFAASESGIVSRYFFCPQQPVHEMPSGYPPCGKNVLIVDDDGDPVAPGAVGEIAVKSRYLAEGYWQDPELTKAKFLPDPASKNKRIYLTGDLGRKGPDGCLYHLGRKDAQVNIRGFRVETSEIERVLSNHKAIKDVVVTAQNDKFGDARLVAYFIPNGKPGPKISELHRLLNQKLPQYMIPSAFVVVDSFPLLPSGKIDRKALVSPSDLRPDLESPLIAPHSDVEAELARIWADVLGLDQVGIQDDFFELGGHSMLAAKLFARVKKTFGKDLSPTTLLYTRTIERLADIVRQKSTPALRSLLIPLQTKGIKPPFFWAGGYASDIHLPRLLGQDQPLYGLLNQCHDGQRQLYSRLEDIAAHHLKEIRAIQPRGPYFLGGFCFGGMVAFEMAQQLTRQGEEVALLFLLDLGTLVNVKALTDRLANSPIRLSEPETFRDELSRHVSTLAKLKRREILNYVGVRLRDRTNALVSTVRNVGNALYYRACLVTGRPIPPALQLDCHIVRVDKQVMRKYVPQPHTGRMIHIKAESSAYNPQLVAMLSTGQLETHELSCDHGKLVQEPHISIWAEWLKSYLQKTDKPPQAVHRSLSSTEIREEAIVG